MNREWLLALRKEIDRRLEALDILERPLVAAMREMTKANGIRVTSTGIGERPGPSVLIRGALELAGKDGIDATGIVEHLKRAGYPYPDDPGKVPVRTRVTNELWRLKKRGDAERIGKGRFRLVQKDLK